MKVIITGGGTAGHVNPALSIASTIRRYDNGAVIKFVGTKKGIESTLVPKAGYDISYIEVSGLHRSLTLKNAKVAYKAIKSYLDCKKLLKNDIILLCSDGLTNMLSDDDIKHHLIAEENPQLIAQNLVKMANENGGTDNITVIVLKGYKKELK